MTWLAGMALAASLSFVEMNCENLFDCKHDSLKQDTDWVIGGARRWSYKRYWRKLNDIGQAILACGEYEGRWSLPDLVALVEVENDSVLFDLTKRSLLRRAEYEYIMTQSDDVRGIDVALLYSPFSFKPLQHRNIRPPIFPGYRPTRDILHVKGLVISDDTLHVFVVHAPSRFGGERTTRPYRMAIASLLGATVDSICRQDHDAKIIITGDFNDYAGDPLTIAVTDKKFAELPTDDKGETKKLPKDAVMYRIPGTAKVTLSLNGKRLWSRDGEYAQYGVDFGLQPTLFSDRRAKSYAIFDTATGALKEIGEVTE